MKRGIAVVNLLLLASPAVAHDTWVLAAPSRLPAPGAIRLDMTSGMAFPAPESDIAPERVTRAMFRIGSGKAASLGQPSSTPEALRYSPSLADEGVAVLWVQLAPRSLDLEPGLIDEYLREIGAAETIGPRWRARGEPKLWREVYRKHAKTFVRIGDSKADAGSWRTPVGMELELLPESDPTTLVAGARLTLVLLKDGRPLSGTPIAAERGEKEQRARTFQTSDSAGRASFTLDRPGPWLFAVTELREKGAEWESDFTTLTVHVQPSRLGR